jgi:hypothetical protein
MEYAVGGMFVPPTNSYVESLTTNVKVFGGGACGKKLVFLQ